MQSSSDTADSGKQPEAADHIGNNGETLVCLRATSSDEEPETSSLETPPGPGRCSAPISDDSCSLRRRKNDSKEKETGSKICRICGDKALGYNFNVISCESCKAFFRRNALKKKEFVCPFNDNCEVTFVSRRFCQKCRLRKCVEAGMNADWIMSEEALEAKRRRRMNSNTTPMDMARTTPVERETLAISAPAIYPRPTSVESGLISASLIAKGSMTSSLHSQRQFALLTEPGGGVSKVIAILPVQSLQQPAPTLGHLNNDESAGNIIHLGNSTSTVPIGGSTGQIPPTATGQLAGLPQTTGNKCDEETINIPKSVLINLISKFHSGADDSTTSKATNSKQESSAVLQQRPPKKCCCKCTCGANPSGMMEVEKSDKIVGTEDLQREEYGVFHRNPTHMVPPAIPQFNNPPSSSPFDFGAVPSSRGCRSLSRQPISQQQSMYGNVLDAAIASVFQGGNGGASTATSNFCVHPVHHIGPAAPMVPGQRRQLSAIEQQRLDELLAANELMKEPLEGMGEQRTYEGHHVDPKLLDVINMTDIAVRRIIKMNKRIEAFRNLCQEDQIALLKGGCTELMILRGIMTYDPEKDSWLTRVQNSGHEYIKLEVLKGVKGNIYEEHKKYVQSFPAAWRTSEPIMLIIGAITLFSPDRPNVVHRELIRVEEQFYYDLLRKYLSTIYDYGEAEAAYAGLVARLDTLHRVNEYAASIFLDINPRDVEPLLIEIYMKK